MCGDTDAVAVRRDLTALLDEAASRCPGPDLDAARSLLDQGEHGEALLDLVAAAHVGAPDLLAEREAEIVSLVGRMGLGRDLRQALDHLGRRDLALA